MCLSLDVTTRRTVEVPRARPRRMNETPGRIRGEADILRTVAGFEAGVLPRSEWTHEAHLAVALYYARALAPEDAFVKLRDGIRRYNAATGLPDTSTRGYHETITLAWFHLVRHFMQGKNPRGRSFIKSLMAHFRSRDHLFRHYSRFLLSTPGARATRVEPDLKPLPALRPFTDEDRRWAEALGARIKGLAGERAPMSVSASV